MRTSCIRLVAALGLLSALSMAGAPARAQLPPIGNPGIPGLPGTPVCPPNSSCAPGTPTPPTNPPGTCGPGNSGSTCGGAGPAAMGGSTGVNVGAGNPINIINGNKYQREVDMAPLPGVLGLEIVRHYNSSLSGPGASTNLVGRGWKLSYETDLYVSGRTLQMVQADGSRIIFNRDARDPSLCASADPANGTISIVKTARGDEYVWRWADGRQLSFDTKGKLVQILAPGGQFVSLRYDPAGLLTRVTDPQGRSLDLSYPSREQARAGDAFRGVQSIASPVGRFTYHYGSAMPAGADIDKRKLLANLVKVDMPLGARSYHYEQAAHPTFLTGISELVNGKAGKPAWQRIATYGYDINGKANLSVRGWPARLARGADGKPLQPARLADGTGIGQVTLEYNAGATIVTNSQGRRTVFRHAILAGEYRLLEVRGAGCSGCGNTNVRYTYDELARLQVTTRLSAAGEPLSSERQEYDRRGRLAGVDDIAYARGRALPARSRLRYEYEGDSIYPARIVRPSVVPGQSYVTSFRYAAKTALAGLPVEVSEQGYMPTLEGTGSAGTITRTVRYGYDHHGQRVEVDGPLPNAAAKPGPANSDITLTRYDGRTKLPLRTEMPGGAVTEVLERDAALRPAVTRFTDAAGVQVVRVRYNWRGQPEEMRIEDSTAGDGAPLAQTVRFTYDLNGKLLGAIHPGDLASRFGYDAAGRMTRKWLPDGSSVAAVYNTEGRRTSAVMLDAHGRQLSTASYRLDEAGRVAGMDDSLGAVAHASFTPAGAVARISNPLGIATRFDYDDNGMLVSRTSAPDTPDAASIGFAYDAHGRQIQVTDANGVTTLRRFDDFGRPMLEVSPDRGVTLYFHDPAGRLLLRSDGRGNDTRYRHDLQGRLVAVGTTTIPELTRYRYVGRRLVEIVATPDGKAEHATERTTYRYDALGQVLEEKRWFARVDVKNDTVGLSFITTNTYDAAGRLLMQVLPDGHELAYHYGAKDGALRGISFDQEVVLDNITYAPAGVASFKTGNGIHESIERDQRGQVVAIRSLASARPAQGGLAQVRARFGAAAPSGERTIYAQGNEYDAAGRLVAIRRDLGQAGSLPQRRIAERYTYDRLDRLTNIATSDGPRIGYAYNKGGNRTMETRMPVPAPATSKALPSFAGTRNYLYAAGTNRLIGLAQPGDGNAQDQDAGRPRLAKDSQFDTSWLYRANGAPFARIAFAAAPGTMVGQPRPASRRIVYNLANRPLAVYEANERLVAAYAYNSRGERFAKTVFASASPANGIVRTSATNSKASANVTYSLYRGQRLASEADSAGRITAHYIYLDGKPVAKVELRPNGNVVSGLLRQIRSLGSPRTAQPFASASIATMYAIHTDHLGTPQAVTNLDQDVVWQARVSPFGQAEILHTGSSAGSDRFDMKLRLPGQVFDAETGLNHNYLRDYDPALGRYATPDPMGLAGGFNPYLYADGNPMTKVDPLGLYAIDVHYYMTMFLARMAGVDDETALIIAQATHHIDDNPDTWPLDEHAPIESNNPLTTDARNRLEKYHFTTSSPDWYNLSDYDPPRTAAEVAYRLAFGSDAQSYIERRIKNPTNPQLDRLMAASTNAPTPCAKAQFFGEYLHAFEDSFAHRAQDNTPIQLNLNTGHLWWGESPDRTYNHVVGLPELPYFLRQPGDWSQNAARTYQMEYEVFNKMRQFGGTTGKNMKTGQTIRFRDIADFLEDWNKLQDNAAKISALNAKLESFGLGSLPVYDNGCATAMRNAYIGGLKQSDYDGTILPTSTGTAANVAAACK